MAVSSSSASEEVTLDVQSALLALLGCCGGFAVASACSSGKLSHALLHPRHNLHINVTEICLNYVLSFMQLAQPTGHVDLDRCWHHSSKRCANRNVGPSMLACQLIAGHGSINWVHQRHHQAGIPPSMSMLISIQVL